MILVCFVALWFAAASSITFEDVVMMEWELYKYDFNKSYESPIENHRRMRIFMKNKFIIAEHNLRYLKGQETYEMGLTRFCDLYPSEIRQFLGYNSDLRNKTKLGESVKFPKRNVKFYEKASAALPESVNWVEVGAVTPVKDMGECASGYAFSAIEALESRYYMKTDKLIALSAQQIIDCSKKQKNLGCLGGDLYRAYDYILRNKGVTTAANYPYEAKDGSCRSRRKKIGARMVNYESLPVSEQDLQYVIAEEGPVAAAIDVLPMFLKYHRGIYQTAKCKSDRKNLNHAVLVVGYGTDAKTGLDYWLVKNSWGYFWGESGYFKIARNKKNMCGIASDIIYPVVD